MSWPISIEACPDLQPNTRLQAAPAFCFVIFHSAPIIYCAFHHHWCSVQCAERKKEKVSQIYPPCHGRTVAFLLQRCTTASVPIIKRGLWPLFILSFETRPPYFPVPRQLDGCYHVRDCLRNGPGEQLVVIVALLFKGRRIASGWH